MRDLINGAPQHVRIGGLVSRQRPALSKNHEGRTTSRVKAQAARHSSSPLTRRMKVDIFDRIAAAIAALKNGNDAALQEHVTAIDAHLSQLDETEAGDQVRLGNIEQGLQKIADAVNPPPPADDAAAASGAQEEQPAGSNGAGDGGQVAASSGAGEAQSGSGEGPAGTQAAS